ncbi:MAG: DUF2782 domain-containing protein [Dokdonella sp.]
MNAVIRLTLSTVFLAAAGLFATGAIAADPRPTKADVPPPPGMDDAGVSAAAASAPSADTVAPVEGQTQDPLAPLPKPDARLVRDKASRDVSATEQRIAGSNVTTRKQGSDTVEEYRENGHVWMIKIVPKNGPTQTFTDADGSGRLARDPHAGPISPVYYTLYEWK